MVCEPLEGRPLRTSTVLLVGHLESLTLAVAGSFEDALHHVINQGLELFGLDARYGNDHARGAPYPRGKLFNFVRG